MILVMREHVVRAVLVGAIGALGLGAVPVVAGLAPPQPGEYIPVAEYYWLNKYRYERHVGKNACNRITGAYGGTIRDAFYNVRFDGIEKEWRWLYTIQLSANGMMLAPAANWTATTGQCTDGRPH